MVRTRLPVGASKMYATPQQKDKQGARETHPCTGSRRLEFRDGDLGLLWQKSQPKHKVIGWVPGKEPILTLWGCPLD